MKTYFEIQEVSELLDVPQSTIRYYCNEFSCYLSLKRGSKNQRKFKAADIGKLDEIIKLSGPLKLEGIRQWINGEIEIKFNG